MKRIVACLVLLSAFAPQAGSASQAFKWFGFQEAITKATDTDRLIVVDVYTDWCGWCKKLDKQVYAREDVQAYLSSKFVPVKLNAEDVSTTVEIAGEEFNYAELAAAYGVRSYPTTLFLMSDGKLLYGLRGYHPPDRFLQALKYFGEGTYRNDLEKSGAGE